MKKEYFGVYSSICRILILFTSNFEIKIDYLSKYYYNCDVSI